MVRATRSSLIHHQKDIKDKDIQIDTSPTVPKLKQVGRKRKRSSILDNESQPSLKQVRGDTEEAAANDDAAELSDIPHDMPFVGELSLSETDASKILDVLEMCVS